jgi:GT2 family glycosyltransferase
MPDISIVIPVFNCLDLTRACQASLEETIGGRDDFEVIFADDASTDDTFQWLKSLPAPRYRFVRHDSNRGYAAANNSAAKIARGQYLVLLNNDTVLLPGWLEAMLRVLARAPNAGVVGNVQREADSGLIDHLGVYFTLDGYPVHAGKDTVSPPAAAYHTWPAVTAACCVMRRDLFIGLGGFDEGFQNSYEDTDFCLKARAMGLHNYVANRSVIYHHVSASPGRKDNDVRNFQRFWEQWGKMISRMAKDEIHARELRQIHQHWHDDGWRYLRKHALRPWRYNATRLRGAIAGVFSRLPASAAVTPEPFFRA